MPEISRFLGIVIAMFYREHAASTLPRFLQRLQHHQSGAVTGTFPRRALAHVQEWRELHRSELLEDWRLAGERKLMNKIVPLE